MARRDWSCALKHRVLGGCGSRDVAGRPTSRSVGVSGGAARRFSLTTEQLARVSQRLNPRRAIERHLRCRLRLRNRRKGSEWTSGRYRRRSIRAVCIAVPNPNDWWLVRLLGSITPTERTTIVRLLGQSYLATGMARFLTSIAQQLTFGPGGTTAGSGGAWYPTPQFAGLGAIPFAAPPKTTNSAGVVAQAVASVSWPNPNDWWLVRLLGSITPTEAGSGGAWYPTPQFAGLGAGPAVSASLARAEPVGRLSVPPSWAVAAPAFAEKPEAGTPMSVIGEASSCGQGGLLRGIPLARAGRRTGAFAHRYGFRHSVITRSPSAG